MKGLVTLRTILASAVLLGTLGGGCRSMKQTMDRISTRTQRSVDRVTTNIERTERKVLGRLNGR